MSLTLSDFDYQLPPSAIAQSPAQPRDSSRLLVLNRQPGTWTDHHFYDLAQLIPSHSVLVRNNTRVMPARIVGHKTTGGQVELMLTRRIGMTAQGQEIWECLTKPGLKLGQQVGFADSALTATCSAITDYTREITFSLGKEALFEQLYQIGQTPIPPYIHWSAADEPKLRVAYQTLYAKVVGSAAAPTAGLHFTHQVETALAEKQVEIIEVTLHVGLGTFLPVKTTDITKHHLHKEWFSLTPAAAERINQAKQTGKKIISVGTTTTRVLENCATGNNTVAATSGETQIYLYPPYRFQIVDAQITNFHLPKSSLLMMMAALVSFPNTTQHFTHFQSSLLGQAYQHAIATGYRFYSFGDAMLIR